METGTWTVVFYVETGGGTPVRAFLEGLDLKTQARLRRAVELLVQCNVTAGEPLVRHLEGMLWELRVESNTNIYRIVYAFSPGRRIVLLHRFQKKTQKTPRREIETAARRFEDFQARSTKGGVSP
jgi:phage-related protein